MIGRVGTDIYWMRLGPVDMGPLLQAHIHVRLLLERRLRIIYAGHEFLRRPNPKARWQAAETVRIPLDPASTAQITALAMYSLWSILLTDLSVESISDQPADAGVFSVPFAQLPAPENEEAFGSQGAVEMADGGEGDGA